MEDLLQPIRCKRLLLFILFLTHLFSTSSLAQAPSDPIIAIQQLNQQLAEVSTLALDTQSENRVRQLAQQRMDLIKRVLQDSPASIKGLLLDSSTVSLLPASVQPFVEQNADDQGTLSIVVEDYARVQQLHFFLDVNQNRRELFFAASAPTSISTGAQVRIHGYRFDDSVLVDTNGLQVVSPATTSISLGAQTTAVLLVNFADDVGQPYTSDQARNVVFNTTSSFFLENSQQQTWLTGDVFGWLTIPSSSNTCPTLLALASAVRQAATGANLNLSNYDHQVYIFPHFACDWLGASSFGGSPSVSAINGNLSLAVVGHELGHGLGLLHSHSLVCPGTSVGTNCAVDDYGDRFDLMGEYTSAHYNAFQKERLGWLNYGSSLPITTVESSGTYHIAPYETTQGVKALKVVQNDGAIVGQRKFYYIEYRQLIGFDTVLSQYPASTTGVLIHSGAENDPDSSLLLNMNPQDTSFAHAALSVGQSFFDPNAGIAIQTLSVDSSGATVNIQLSGGTGGCQHNAPQVTATPARSMAVSPGALVHYGVTVTNEDSGACAASSFLLGSPVAPAGWTAITTATYFTLAPGESGSADLQVTSSTAATAGDYPVTITALAWPNYSLRSSTSVVYSISGSAVPDFVFSATPTILNVTRGKTGSALVTSTPVGGFSSPVSLSVTGVPSGVLAQFTPTLIAGGSGNSTLTFSVANLAPLGYAAITVTGTGGTLSHTVLVGLNVTDVPATLTSLALSPITPSSITGSSLQFRATGTYSNGSTADLTTQVSWTSDTPSVATINSAGLATAISSGSAKISASFSGLVASTMLTVTGTPPGSYSLLGNQIPAAQDMRYAQGVEVGLKFTSDVPGSIVGVRFYKSANAFGTHVGELWSIAGQRLASVNFANESPSGWQQVNLPAPVAISANTPYLVSLHTDGPFSFTDFSTAIDKPPLHAPASGILGGNGVYALGPVGTFPGLGGGANYLVDVMFTSSPTNTTLTSIQVTPANQSIMKGSTLQFHAIGTYSNGSTADITNQVGWSSSTPAVATINASGLAAAVATGSTRILASLSNVTASTMLTVTAVSSNSYSLFGNQMFAAQGLRYAQGVEVGLKFTSDVPGTITAIRFYKTASAFGTHVGELWTTTGQRLASDTFAGETASGWQQVNLTAPVPINANTPYIVSYHSDGPLGFIDFSTSVDKPPLHAPASGVLGGNGVYALGPVGTFPALGGGSNYLVDVVFVP